VWLMNVAVRTQATPACVHRSSLRPPPSTTGLLCQRNMRIREGDYAMCFPKQRTWTVSLESAGGARAGVGWEICALRASMSFLRVLGCTLRQSSCWRSPARCGHWLEWIYIWRRALPAVVEKFHSPNRPSLTAPLDIATQRVSDQYSRPADRVSRNTRAT
jgi:hypothetical protein